MATHCWVNSHLPARLQVGGEFNIFGRLSSKYQQASQQNQHSSAELRWGSGELLGAADCGSTPVLTGDVALRREQGPRGA